MIEDKPIDYKTEYNKTINKLVSLRQKHDGLKEDYDYIKSLADRYFDERIKLKKENEQLKEQLEICKDARQAYKQDWKACVSYCDTYKDEIHTLKDNIQGLIEENKELKSLCKVLIKHIDEKSIAFVIDENVRRLLE